MISEIYQIHSQDIWLYISCQIHQERHWESLTDHDKPIKLESKREHSSHIHLKIDFHQKRVRFFTIITVLTKFPHVLFYTFLVTLGSL